MSELAEAIAARTGLSDKDVLRVLVDAQCARDGIGPPSYRPASVRDPSRSFGFPKASADDFIIMRQLDHYLAVTSHTSVHRPDITKKK